VSGIGVRIYEMDQRSSRSIVTTLSTINMCREYIDKYVEEGYGINIVPELNLLSDESKSIWIEILCDIIIEMIKNKHEVIAIERPIDRDLRKLIEELNKRKINIDVKQC
jgi:hypothetical protein